MKVVLSEREQVLVRTRPHPRALLGVAWAAAGLMALAGFAQGLISRLPELGDPWDSLAPGFSIGVWVICGLGVIAWVIAPALRWLRRRYVLTNQRVLSLKGRRVSELPLSMLTGIDARPGVGAGQDGSGTLVLYTERGDVKLRHVPSVRRAADIVRRSYAALPFVSPSWPGRG